MTAHPQLAFPPPSLTHSVVHYRRQHLSFPPLRETCCRGVECSFPLSALFLAQGPHAPHIPGSAEWMDSSCCSFSTGFSWNNIIFHSSSGRQLVGGGEYYYTLKARSKLNLVGFNFRSIYSYYLPVKVSISMKYSKQAFLMSISWETLTVWWFLWKIKYRINVGSSHFTSGYMALRMKGMNPNKYLCIYIHNSLHNSTKMETAQEFMDRWIDKQNIVCLYTHIYLHTYLYMYIQKDII